MIGAKNVDELIIILREAGERWHLREFEARREGRDQDAEECRQNHVRCVNLAAELSTPAMVKLI